LAKFIEPKIISSYYKNNKGAEYGDIIFKPNIGRTLYDYVINSKPKIIIEFGVMHGYSTICMAQALNKLGRGKVYGYDLWENFEYKHGQRIWKTKALIEKYNLSNIIKLKYGNFFEYINNPDYFVDKDLVHIDINNDGNILNKVYNKLVLNPKIKCDILFEGGIRDRDNCWWMKKYNRPNMHTLKKTLGFEILNDNYPGLSLLKSKK